MVFPSDDITNETIRRDNKRREEKMNVQKQFDDLYQYLNSNNKTKAVIMARTGKTRNMLTLSRKNEKYTRMQNRLKPIKEIFEPESDYLMNNNSKIIEKNW